MPTRRQVIAAATAAGLSTAVRRPGQRPDGGGGLPTADPILRAIPSSGERVPVIGMGTWQTFDVGADRQARENLRAVLSAFVGAGGRVIDSSPMYGTSETVYGDLAAELGLGDEMFVATKVWTTGRDAGVAQMRESMRRMRVQRVDLMQVHNLVGLETHLATLRAGRDEGRIRYIGITHYQESAHDDVARVIAAQPVDVIQINYSLAERGAERRLLPLARDRGVGVVVNRPFGGGGLFRRLRGRALPDWAADVGATSWAQLLLKFVIANPAVICAIPASSRVDHTIDNAGAGVGPLPDATQLARIAALL